MNNSLFMITSISPAKWSFLLMIPKSSIDCWHTGYLTVVSMSWIWTLNNLFFYHLPLFQAHHPPLHSSSCLHAFPSTPLHLQCILFTFAFPPLSCTSTPIFLFLPPFLHPPLPFLLAIISHHQWQQYILSLLWWWSSVTD